ncbi:MAG: DUF1549 domain-containing protein, partial [Planctomycetes bacterium]|nr:DUF1549 domain-containing protein [Planctomycetota bacterium]
MKEEAVLFGKTGSLVGIVSDPSDSDSGKNLPAVILLNSGLIHRVGPNRVYVKIARRLAAEGFVAFRFDFSSIGDSLVRYDNLSFEKSAVDEVQDAMDFLELVSPDKRRKVVDRLLEDPGYITHFTTFWRNVMMPEVNADFQVRFLVPGFDAWLRKQLTENTHYDVLVKEILTTPLDTGRNNRRNPYERLGEPSPLAFFQAKQIAPENLAAATSRIFLGIRLECAQCHDHPFDHWTQAQFEGLAAQFGQTRLTMMGVEDKQFQNKEKVEYEVLVPESETDEMRVVPPSVP